MKADETEDETFQILHQVVEHAKTFRVPETQSNFKSYNPSISHKYSASTFTTAGYSTHFDWLTSIKEPILEVVNEMCSSPMTISSSCENWDKNRKVDLKVSKMILVKFNNAELSYGSARVNVTKQTCLPTLSGGGHSASSSLVISLSSMILFSSSITLLCTYAWVGTEETDGPGHTCLELCHTFIT